MCRYQNYESDEQLTSLRNTVLQYALPSQVEEAMMDKNQRAADYATPAYANFA